MKTKPIPETPNASTDAPPKTPEDVLALLRSQLSAAQAHARQSIEKSISEVRQSIDASRALMGTGERFLRESPARTDQSPDPNQKKVEDAFRCHVDDCANVLYPYKETGFRKINRNPDEKLVSNS